MEVYDRQRDIYPYTCTNKTREFGLPSQAIYVLYDPESDRWIYEVFDYNDWDLLTLYDKGRVHGTCMNSKFDFYSVAFKIATMYPDAFIVYVPDYQEWHIAYYGF